MQKDERNIAVYSRKSRFTGKGESIENQVQICKQKIFAQYPDISDEKIIIFEDEGYSGSNTNRPQFQQMMNEIKQNKIKAVFSYRLDRISRSVVDFANMYDVFCAYSVVYVSATECYETSTPLGRAMMSIATVFAQLERETIAERIKDNMCALAKTGRWLGGVTPTGYQSKQGVGSVTADGRVRKAYLLKTLPNEARLVQQIFSTYLNCGSLTKLELILNQKGIVSKNGKPFNRVTLGDILKNPVYMCADQTAYDYFAMLNVQLCGSLKDFNGKCGIMAYNKTLQKSGKTTKNNAYQNWIVAVGRHQPLIGSEDYIRVQNLLKKHSGSNNRQSQTKALLTNLLFCGRCGAPMRPKYLSRTDKQGNRQFYYICKLKQNIAAGCEMANLNGNKTDQTVLDKLGALNENKALFKTLLFKFKANFKAASFVAESENPFIANQTISPQDLTDFNWVVHHLKNSYQRKILAQFIEKAEWNGQNLNVKLL